MDISDKEYKKYKLQIKIWEHKFKKRESRVPSKVRSILFYFHKNSFSK